MKTQYIDYSHNSDLSESVREAIPDDALQSVFRAALNSHLRDGKSEMHAYIKAYRALEDLGYVKGEDGKWSVAKDAPGVGDVHVPRPLGGKKPKRKDDPGTDPADIPEFEDLAEQLGKRFVPPDEVRAAAKRAWSEPDTFSVPEITETLAKGEGLGIAEVRKIAAHFADSSHEDSAAARGAWGGELASKWASRVLRKFGDVSKRPKKPEYEEVEMKRSVAHAGACDLCQQCADQGFIPADDPFESGEDEPEHHPNCQCTLETKTMAVHKGASERKGYLLTDLQVKDVSLVAAHKRVDDVELWGSVVKLDQAQHLVFGWASIVSVNGKLVTDTQGDRIAEQTIEDSAYEFVLDARVAGVMHTESSEGKPVQIGSLVESCVFTPDKAAAMLASLKVQGIDAEMRMPFVGWWIGFKVSDPVTWDKVTSGELKAFSVGGRGKRAAIAA